MYSRWTPELEDAKRAVTQHRRKRKPNSAHEKQVRANNEKQRRDAEKERQRKVRRRQWEERVQEARQGYAASEYQDIESDEFRQWFESTYFRPFPFSRLDDRGCIYRIHEEWERDTGREPEPPKSEEIRMPDDTGILTAYPTGDYSTSTDQDIEDYVFDEPDENEEHERHRQIIERLQAERATLNRTMPPWAWEGVCEVYNECENERIETGKDYEVEHIIQPVHPDHLASLRLKVCGLHCAANLKTKQRRKRSR